MLLFVLLLVWLLVELFVIGAVTVFVGLAVLEIVGETVVIMLVVGTCDLVRVVINSINLIKSAAVSAEGAAGSVAGVVPAAGVVGVVPAGLVTGVVAGVVAGSVVGVLPSTAAPAVNFDVDFTLYFLKYLTFDDFFTAFLITLVATPPAGLISLKLELAALDAGAKPRSEAVIPRATTFFTEFMRGVLSRSFLSKTNGRGDLLQKVLEIFLRLDLPA